MVRLRARNGDTYSESVHQRTARDKRNAQKFTLGEKYHGFNRSLSNLEEEFIYAAEFGDIPTVQKVLEENQSFNVDYHDILGRTPLRLAVGNEHREVVELLLDRSNIANIHEALLQAISAGHEQIAETILKHPKYIDVKRENKRFGETDYFFNTTAEDSPFSADITPLILAAERNQFEIIQLLLLRGDTINKPHHYYCNCQECSNKLQFDQLRLAKTRLNAYKGLASGAYISLSSKDPILTAFELARELRGVAKVEKYYKAYLRHLVSQIRSAPDLDTVCLKNEYLALADQLSGYIVRLLDKVRGHDELEILLNKKGRDSDDESYELLSRLKLAIHYNEKKFVAHPSCQQKLVSIWYDDLRSLERSNWFFRSMMVFCVALAYPVLAILYMFVPKSKVGRFIKYPCIKFIGHAISFITFLVMIVVSSVSEKPNITNRNFSVYPKSSAYNIYNNSFRKNYSLCSSSKIQKVLPVDFALRTCEPEMIHMLLTLWIIGMLWQELKQVYAEGLYDYFDSLYNYLDVAVLTLYITSFTMRFVSIMKVNEALVYFEDKEHWKLLCNGESKSSSHWYWLPADRFYWNAWDPHNMAEGLFAIANIISFTRFTYLLPANELFGPMQISLARMITDILKFVVIFLVVFVAFMVGLHNLYWYYPVNVRRSVQFAENNIETAAEKNFGIIDQTFITVFWSLFGRGDSSVVELGDFNSYFIENVGYIIFGAYNISTVIVLLNMLIAMMSRSFEIIQEEADTEWKFARTKLYMEYIRDDATLPIPFNIVPTFKSLIRIIQYCCRTCCPKKKEADVKPHPGRVKDREMFNSTANSPAPDSTATPGWEDNHEVPTEQSKGIKRFRERNNTTNGFVRCDSDPDLVHIKLTYKRVMKRIVKRYIFDVQREDDASEVDFDELKQDISSFRYEMLNYVSKNTGTDELASRMSQMELKLNRLVEQQIILLKGMANDQFKLAEGQVKPVSSGTALEEQVSEQSSSQGKKTTKKPTKLLKDIQEEHQTEINSPLFTQNDLQVMDRSPSQKRREFQNVNTDTVPVLASPEDVEMDVLDGEKDLSEVVIEHGNLNHSLSGSTKDFKF